MYVLLPPPGKNNEEQNNKQTVILSVHKQKQHCFQHFAYKDKLLY